MNLPAAPSPDCLHLPANTSQRARAGLGWRSCLTFLAVLAGAWPATAATYTLTSPTGGWDTASWTIAGFPNATDAIAQYDTVGTAATTALDLAGGGSITVEQLRNLNTGNWAITSGTSSGIVIANTTAGQISTTSSGTLSIAPAIALQNASLLISTGVNQTGAITLAGPISGTGNVTLSAARLGTTMITLGDVNNTGSVNVAVSATGHATTQFSLASLGAGVTSLTVGDAANPTFGGRLNVTGNSAFTGPVVIQGEATLATSTAGLNGSSSTNGITFGAGGGTLLAVGNIVTAKAITLNGAGNFTTSSGNNITLSGAITGTSGLTKRGNGNLILSGSTSNTYTGDTFITGGNVTTGLLSLQKTGGAIAVPGDLILDGTALNAAAIGTSANTVRNQFGQQFGTTSVIRFVNNTSSIHAYFSLYGNDQTVAGLSESVASGGVIQNAYTEAFAIDAVLTINNSADFSYAGFLRDKGVGPATATLGIIKTGAGKQTLVGAQITYTGATFVNQGTLELSSATGFASGVNFGTGSTGILQLATAANTVAGLATVDTLNSNAIVQNVAGTNATLTVNQITNTSFGGVLRDNGGNTFSLAKTGVGALTLTGTNSYTGTTTISGGRLVVNGALTDSAVTVQAGGALSGSGTIGLLTGTKGVTVTGGPVAGAIDLQNGAINILVLQSTSDTTVLTLGGTANNASALRFDLGSGGASDRIAVSGGKLLLNAGGARVDLTALTGFGLGTYDILTYGSGQATLTGKFYLGTTAGGGFSYSLVQGATSTQVVVSNTFSNSTWNVNAAGNWFTPGSWTGSIVPNGTGATATLGSIITAARIVTVNDVAAIGTLTINSAQAYTLSASSGGFLVLNNNGAGAALNVTTGTHTISAPVVLAEDTALNLSGTQLTISGGISGTGRLTKTGAGTLVLSGTNTFTGGISFTDGILRITSENSLGAIPTVFNASALFLNNATVESTAGEVDARRGVTLGSSGATFKITSGTTFLRGIVSGSGSITVGTGAGQYAPGGASTYTGGTILQSGSITVPLASSTGAADAPTSGPFGTGTLTLAGGRMRATSGNDVELHNTVILSADTTFISSAAVPANDKNLVFRGSVTMTGGSRMLTVETALNGTTRGVTFSGAIGDGGNNYGLIKAGVSTLILSGANTFTGGLTIREGTVIAEGSASALGGSGTGQVILGHSSGTANATLLSGVTTAYANAITVAAGSFGTSTLGNSGNIASVFSGGITLSKGLNLLSSGTGSVTLSGPIAGTFDISVNGSSGNFAQLSGNNAAFTGDVNVVSGTLRMGSTTALSVVNTVAMSSGGTFDINARSVTIEGLTGTAGTITNSGASATLTVGGAGTYAHGGTITATTPANFNLLKTGSGTQTLSGLSTYTGSTTVNAGVLQLDLGTNTTGVLAATSSLVMSGGTLNVKGAAAGTSSQTLGAFTLTTGTNSYITFTPNGGTGTNLTLGNAWTRGEGATLFVDLSSGSSMLASNPSTLLANGLLNFVVVKDATGTGLGTISGGQIVRAATNELRSNSNDGTVNFITQVGHTDYAGTTLTMLAGPHLVNSLTINTEPGAGTLDLNGTSLTFNSLLVVGNNNFTINGGTLAGTGGSLLKTGTGNLSLTGTGTFTGGTTISEGTLTISGGSALADAGAVVLGNNASVLLQVNASETIGNLSGGGATGGRISVASGATLTVAQTTDLTYAGTIEGLGGFVKSGAGTLVLSNANTYAGLTTVTTGTLRITHGSALGNTGSVTQTIVADGNRLELSGGITVVSENITITGQGLGNQGGLHSAGSRNEWTGQVTLDSNLARVGASGGGTLVISGKITGSVGTHGFAVRTADSSTFSNVVEVSNAGNDYGGNTEIVVGVLRLAAGNNRLPTGTLLRIGNSPNVDRARFDLNGFNQQVTGLESVGTTMLMNVHSTTAAVLTLSNTADRSFNGTITGAVSLVKEGTAMQTLLTSSTGNGNSNYTGTTTINSGTLRAGSVNALSANSAVTLANNAGAVLNLNSFSQVIASLAGGGATGGNVTLGSATLTTGGNNTDTTYAGVISGTGGLTKQGTGRFKLSGTNTYTGATTVSAGSLIVNGSTASGSAVGVTGTLGGNGTVGGVTTINSGGFLNPGDSDTAGGIGKLTFSQGVTMATGSSSTLEIRGATFTSTNGFGGNAVGSDGYNTYVKTFAVGQGDHDQIVFSGTFVQQTGAGFDVVPVSGFSAAYGQIYNLLDWATLGAATFNGNLGTSLRDGSGDALLDLDLPDLTGTGLVWDTSFFASDGILVVVPEPSRMILVLVGFLGLVLRRRR